MLPGWLRLVVLVLAWHSCWAEVMAMSFLRAIARGAAMFRPARGLRFATLWICT